MNKTRVESDQKDIRNLCIRAKKFQCDYEATQEGSLATHRKSVHLGQKFQCPYRDFESTWIIQKKK